MENQAELMREIYSAHKDMAEIVKQHSEQSKPATKAELLGFALAARSKGWHVSYQA